MEAAVRRARIVHTIVLRFEEPAEGARLTLRLTPRALPEQRLEHHAIFASPEPQSTLCDEDPHGNGRRVIELRGPFTTLEIKAVSTVARLPVTGGEGALEILARCGVCPADPPFPEPPRDGREACRIRAEIALERLRAREVPCRYVAGYPWITRRGQVLPHAWIAVEAPGGGFVQYDVMRGELAPGHVVVGWGRGYDDVAPVSGSLQAKGRYRLSSVVVMEPLGVA